MSWFKAFLYIAIFIFVFSFSAYLTINILLKRQISVICPDIRGGTVDDAKRLVESKGLSLSISRYERRNDVPYNHITVQRPEANISTRLGRTVMVIVSEGPELITVPTLEGKSLADAEDILKEKNIEIEKTMRVPHPKAGRVIAQMPKGGEDVIKGKSVTLFVGVEEDQYFLMPDYKDMTPRDLDEEMAGKNIRHRIDYVREEKNSTKMTITTSVPPKMIFKNDGEIEIKVLSGG